MPISILCGTRRENAEIILRERLESETPRSMSSQWSGAAPSSMSLFAFVAAINYSDVDHDCRLGPEQSLLLILRPACPHVRAPLRLCCGCDTTSAGTEGLSFSDTAPTGEGGLLSSGSEWPRGQCLNSYNFFSDLLVGIVTCRKLPGLPAALPHSGMRLAGGSVQHGSRLKPDGGNCRNTW